MGYSLGWGKIPKTYTFMTLSKALSHSEWALVGLKFLKFFVYKLSMLLLTGKTRSRQFREMVQESQFHCLFNFSVFRFI